jgi:4-diphosphocytidyl-2C-methyl-D-erythritol kinase
MLNYSFILKIKLFELLRTGLPAFMPGSGSLFFTEKRNQKLSPAPLATKELL